MARLLQFVNQVSSLQALPSRRAEEYRRLTKIKYVW